ncbi:MAG TPA: hypothetical protein DCY88_07665 [Cyanobacteria bacterium UBA11372]|nr:hypothetical protein [Cyanobacteria bacterium UBA11372]HBE31771.1 hypothetical protein [Cyanobacteria bacterium UBA11368]HBE53801.1 hypothetical protein [Cyanobacteria bacterium UBA11369]
MWQLTNPTTIKAELEFSSSFQSKISVTQLWDDNVQLINAVEYVNWGEAELQFIVCEACGIVGCQPQGWVELKRADSVVFIMPAFTTIEKASEKRKEEYLPPHYLLERGAICIEQKSYANTLCQIAAFPDFEALSLLSAWEASKIFQLEAPSRVLGHLLNPSELYQDIVIASSEGNFKEQAFELISLVNNLSRDTRTAKLRRLTEYDQIISLYVDISGFPEWKALSYNGLRYSLYLEPGYIID